MVVLFRPQWNNTGSSKTFVNRRLVSDALKLPSRTQYLKKAITVQKTYMKQIAISELQLGYVHYNHWGAGKDLCAHENLIWSSDPKWNFSVFFHERRRSQIFQWHHKWRLTIKKAIKDWETVYIYTCWFKTTAWNVCKGWMSRDERFEFVIVGNQVSSLIKKGDFLFLFFFPLESLKEKKKDYSTGNFNLKFMQPHFLITCYNQMKKIHYLLYNGFSNFQNWNQCFSQIPLCCNTSMTWQRSASDV